MKEKKGKILKVRRGYNANSSSISTVVTYFLWGSTAVVAVVNTIAAVVFAGDGKNGGPVGSGKSGGKSKEVRKIEAKKGKGKNGGRGSRDERVGKDG